MQTTDDQRELFDLVNENDEIIGTITRGEANSRRGLLHRAVGIFVFNDQSELFMQKRSLTKDVEPGTWTISAAGHVKQGQTYAEAADRELKEELGVESSLAYLKKYIVESKNETEINKMYLTNHNGPFHLHPDEIETGRFFSMHEIEKRIRNKTLNVNPWAMTHLHFLYGILPERRDLVKAILKVF